MFTVADIARLGHVGDRGAALSSSSPADAETAFRRSRGLLTADSLTAWLEDWAIAPDDFLDWTRDRATGGTTASPWCALVCSGAFEARVAAVAAAAAAACRLGRPPASASTFDPQGWVDRLAAATATEDALRETIARHRLGWTRLVGQQVVAPTRSVCAELRQWVVEDGSDLAEAAARAGCAVTAVDHTLDELEPATLRPYLAGTGPTDIMGPVEAPNGWNLVVVHERRETDPRDPEVRARAAALLRAEAVAAALTQHVGP